VIGRFCGGDRGSYGTMMAAAVTSLLLLQEKRQRKRHRIKTTLHRIQEDILPEQRCVFTGQKYTIRKRTRRSGDWKQNREIREAYGHHIDTQKARTSQKL
jgi:hypothetical protein